MLAKNISSV